MNLYLLDCAYFGFGGALILYVLGLIALPRLMDISVTYIAVLRFVTLMASALVVAVSGIGTVWLLNELGVSQEVRKGNLPLYGFALGLIPVATVEILVLVKQKRILDDMKRRGISIPKSKKLF
ncbi:MAG TPA: hypothetical protein VK914_05745 [bacterium]|nr:hypothetical protein [bacterium]